MTERLILAPISHADANAYVSQYHRHHGPTLGCKFALACCDETGLIHGVAIVGRPVARNLDDRWTVEVTRLATDGTPNACSLLYGAEWRTAKALGYQRIITYILDTERGTSLVAAGWRCAGMAGGGSWIRLGRPRSDAHPLGRKTRWEQLADDVPRPLLHWDRLIDQGQMVLEEGDGELVRA